MQAPRSTIKKNKDVRLVGLEFENQLVYSKSGFPIKRKDTKALWEKLVGRKWTPVYDKYTSALVGVNKKTNQGEIVVNTDTGVCNLEVAFPPKKNLIEAQKEHKKKFSEIISVAKKLGFTAISLGVTPRKINGDPYNLKTEKGLYLIINDWLIRHNVQIPISSHQVCIDVKIEDMTKSINCLSKLSGLIIALTANSVIENEKIQNWKEIRTLHWKVPISNEIKNIDNIFGGIPSKSFKNLSDYFKFIWNGTPLIIIKNGEWIRLKDWRITTWQYLTSGKEFDAITADKKTIKVKADESDLNLMMMLAWNDVKVHIIVDSKKIKLDDFINAIRKNLLEKYLKNKISTSYLEIRMCPVSPKGEEMTTPAFLLGLVNNLKELENFCKKFSWEEGREMKNILSIKGMDCMLKNKSVSFYLEQLLKISEIGLKKRKFGEEKFLNALYVRLKEEKNPADKTIEIFKKEGVSGVLKVNMY